MLPVPEHVHGTLNGYVNYSCRCERCRAAYREYRRAYREYRRAYREYDRVRRARARGASVRDARGRP